MHRRELLQAGAAAAGLVVCGGRSAAAPASKASTVSNQAPAVLAGYTAADQRARLRNIGICRRAIRTCLREHLVTNYLPGQCCYNPGVLPGSSGGPAQLRLVGFRARAAGSPAHARPLAEALPAAGRRRHVGLAGNRTVRSIF